MTRVLRAAAACVVATAVMVAVVVGAGDSALTKAVKAGDLQAVRALVKQGADVNAKSGDGSTPLLWAADGGEHEIARVLIAAKAKVDVATDLGVTPLLQASRVGDTVMVDLLLRAGANPSLAHPDGETPLMAASKSGSIAAVRTLLARGANVNDTDKFQNATALMRAAAEGPEQAGARHVDQHAQECRSSDRRLLRADVGRAQRQRGDGSPAGQGRRESESEER
jgi:ankyrin repeat protein